MEDMHDSMDPALIMRCSHAMHSKCFEQYIKSQYQCPICKQSVIDPKLFESQIDRYIESMPLEDPEELDKEMLILCNDCLSKSRVPYHPYGGKCK